MRKANPGEFGMTVIPHEYPYLIEIGRWLGAWPSLLLRQLLLLLLPLLLAGLDMNHQTSRSILPPTTGHGQQNTSELTKCSKSRLLASGLFYVLTFL